MAKEKQIKSQIILEGEKEYRSACKGINTSLREIGSEMKLATAEFGDNAESIDALTRKQDILKKSLEEQAKKAKAAEDALKKMRDGGIEPTNPAYQKMQTALNNTKADMVKIQKEIDDTSEKLKKSKIDSATLTYELGDFKRVIGCTINNAPIFKRGTIFEQFTIQLSCLNPFWREEAETREDIATWIGGFEFPVPDGLEITPDWEIGYRQPSLIVNVFNSGDVKSGIRIEFRALGALTNPQLLNVNTQEFIKANISLEAGDVLTVSTGYGEKSVKLLSGGVESDAFRYLDVDSSYLQLAVGDNLFRYSADTNAENLEVSIYHNNLYLGV